MIQHEVPDVRPGDHHPLTPRQPRDPAIVEEALDLLVDAPDRLDVAELVHGPRDGDPLVQGKPREGREKAVELRGGGAVPLDAPVVLLERYARGERQGHVLGIFPTQVAREDHQPLVVDGPRHPHLPLDVDDPLLPHEDVGRDARGVPEAVVRQVYDGEAVDLPHHGPVRIHPDDPVLEGSGQLLLIHARPVTLVLDGLADVIPAHARPARPGGPGVGLHQQFPEPAQLRREEVLVLGVPAGPLDDLGQRLRVEGLQVLPPQDVPHTQPHPALRRGRPGHVRVEARLDLEELPELRVVMLQQFVDVGHPDHHDLEVHPNRAGAQRGHGDRPVLFPEVLDGRLPSAEQALDRLPGHEVHEHLLRIEDQKPAVGLMEGARHDAAEVGVEVALTALVLDLPRKVVVGGVGLPDHRSSVLRVVRDEEVAQIPREVNFSRLVPDRGDERPEVLDDVLGHPVEPFRQGLVARVRLADVRHAGGYRGPAYLGLELADPLLEVLLHVADATQPQKRPLGHLLGQRLKTFLLLLVQGLELLLLDLPDDGLALLVLRLDQGDVDEPLGGAFEGEMVLGGPGLELVHDRPRPLLELLDVLRLGVLVLALLEGLADRGPELVQQPVQGGAELLSPAGGHRHRQGLPRLVEVVKVKPVVRGGEVGRPLPETLERIAGAPAARLAGHEDVVSPPRDHQAEGDGLHRPLLADEPHPFPAGAPLVGPLHLPAPGVLQPPQFPGRQLPFIRHVIPAFCPIVVS